MIERDRGQSIGRDHRRHRRRFHRDLHVGKTHLVEVGQFDTRGLNEGLGRRAAEAFVDLGVQGPGVDANANRYAAIARFAGDEFDLGWFAQVSRIQSKPVHARFERREGHLDVKVNVRDDGHRRARHDLGEALGRGLLVAGAANDVGAVGGEGVDLLQRALDVGGLRGRHGLDRDGRVTADLHGPHGNLARHPTGG